MSKDTRYIRVSFDTFAYIIIGIIISALYLTVDTSGFSIRGLLSVIAIGFMSCLTGHALTEIVWRLQNK